MLKQLSGMDSLFLFADSHRAPLEVGCLQIYDPSTAPRGRVRFKEILATFQARLDRSSVFRQKLLEVPFALDNPYWVLDEDFDLEYHVRHMSLPRPGDWNQLMAQVARLQARQLDRSRPLWMAHIIEGLDDVEGLPQGCFAMFIKLHHATVDGTTGQDVQAALHDAAPYQAQASDYRPYTGPQPGTGPSAWELLARTPLNTAVSSAKLGIGVACALRGLAQSGLSRRSLQRRPVPMTPLNAGRVSPNRVVDGRFFALAAFSRIREAEPGPTLNDVALSVVGGALRRYLAERGGLPDDPMIAACPVNVGSDTEAARGQGNLLNLMTAPLYTDIEDPVERLRAIHEATSEAKEFAGALGRSTLTKIPLNLPAPVAKSLYPLLFAVARQTRTRFFNTFVSNVAVRQAPLYMAGARLIRVLATAPVIDQAGLFHTVFSFDGRVSIGFTACREMVPDPQVYAECIQAAFDELEAAALHRPAPRRKASTRRPAARKRGRESKAASARAAGKEETAPPAATH